MTLATEPMLSGPAGATSTIRTAESATSEGAVESVEFCTMASGVKQR